MELDRKVKDRWRVVEWDGVPVEEWAEDETQDNKLAEVPSALARIVAKKSLTHGAFLAHRPNVQNVIRQCVAYSVANYEKSGLQPDFSFLKKVLTFLGGVLS